MVIKQILRRQVSLGGEEHSGWLPPGAAIPNPIPVEVVELDLKIEKYDDDPGYLLIWEDQSGKHFGDSWHQTADEAVEAAECCFQISAEEWVAT